MKKLPKGFTLKEKGRIQYISCDAIEKTGQFTQGFTLRKGGFSRKPFDSLNTGLHTDDNKNDVRKNIRLIETELGAKYIAAAHQVHGDNVVVVQGSRGQGSNGQGAADRDLKIKIQKLRYIKADAVLTDLAGIAAAVRVADCAGTVIVDPVKKIIVSVHSGWRGVANKLPQKAVNLLKKKFKSDPKTLIAAISPAIGPCCFEVGRDVYKLQKQKVFSNMFTKKDSRIYMDIWKGVQNLLISAGMEKTNIYICNMCTFCNPEMFFSYRRDKGQTGRMLVFGVLK